MSLTILIAPSGFKEGLSAEEVADCIEAGFLRAAPQTRVLKAPLVDGGEGFTKTLVAVTNGSLHEVTVTGPTNQPVKAYFGFLRGEKTKTAVLEMAAAAGLRLVPRDTRNPLASIGGCMSILSAPCKPSEAIEHADSLLTDCAENIARILMVGRGLRKGTEA